MPELSRFYGIHSDVFRRSSSADAVYGKSRAVVDIETLAIISGRLPPRTRGLVVEWATIHQDELRAAFRKAEALESPGSISPLD